MAEQPRLAACHCCGLIQWRPNLSRCYRAYCCHCHAPLRHCATLGNQPAAACAVAALLLYPPAVLLPMVEIERLGHHDINNLLEGIATLFAQGDWLIAGLVGLFSLALPLLKLVLLFGLSVLQTNRPSPWRVWAFRGVDSFGRWGMLDVLLVAVLIAFVKLGDLLTVRPGPAVLAFSAMVCLSLVAALLFNPHCMWAEGQTQSVAPCDGPWSARG